MQRERELEQDERHLLRGAPPFQDRQQLAVVPDGLIQRVLLARAVPRARQVRDRLVLVRRGEPMMREEPGDLVLAAGVARFQPRRGAPVQRAATILARVRYAASWISTCLNRYSGSGHRRPSRTRSSRWSSTSARPMSPSSATASRCDRPNERPSTAAASSASRAPGSSRSIRATITFSTVGGTSTSISWSNRQPSSSCTSAPASTSDRTISSRKNGLPSAGSRIRRSISRRELEPADQRAEELPPAAARQRLQPQLARAMRELARRGLLQPPGGMVLLGPERQHEEQRRGFGVRQESLEQLE